MAKTRAIERIPFVSRGLNDTEKHYSIGELELFEIVWASVKFRFYLYGKKVHQYTDHPAIELLIKRNRSNQQYNARLTRWLDRLVHFDIAVQHTTSSNLKITDILSKNPLVGAAIEDKYDEEYVINILTEQAELNAKYGSLFDSQSRNRKGTEAKPN